MHRFCRVTRSDFIRANRRKSAIILSEFKDFCPKLYFNHKLQHFNYSFANCLWSKEMQKYIYLNNGF